MASLVDLGVTISDALQLETALRSFRAGLTPFAVLDPVGEGEGAFTATIEQASVTITRAVRSLLANRAAEDLREALARVGSMQQVYGPPVYKWTTDRRPLEFRHMLGRSASALLSDEAIGDYEAQLDLLRYDLVDTRYALHLETDLLPTYARWLGKGEASLLSAGEGSAAAIALLAEDTASLMVWRMLTVRWCEDHGLFAARYMTGLGIELFWEFAEYFGKPTQELLRQSYRHGQAVFPHVFASSPLDWAVAHDDAGLSHALEHTTYQLSRWNFATLSAGILWGICDRQLGAGDRLARIPQMDRSALTCPPKAATPRA